MYNFVNSAARHATPLEEEPNIVEEVQDEEQHDVETVEFDDKMGTKVSLLKCSHK